MSINVTNVLSNSTKMGANRPLPLLLIGGAALLLFATTSCDKKPKKSKEEQIEDIENEIDYLNSEIGELEEEKDALAKNIAQLEDYCYHGYEYERYHAQGVLNWLENKTKNDCMSYEEACELKEKIERYKYDLSQGFARKRNIKEHELGDNRYRFDNIEAAIKKMHIEKQKLEQQLQSLRGSLNITG